MAGDQQAAVYWAGREQRVPGGPAPGQPGRAGVPAGLGRDHPHRLPRHPHRRPRAGPVRARRADRDVLAAGHQPGRRPAGPCSQPDRPDHPHLSRREVARPGHHERPRGPRRSAGRRGHCGGVRADARVRRGAGSRARTGAATRSAASARRSWTRTPRGPCRCARRNASSRGRGSASTAARRPRASCCTSPTTPPSNPARARTPARSIGTRSRGGGTPRSAANWPGIAPAVSNARGPGAQRREHPGGRAPAGPPAPEAQARALAKALVLVSERHPAWTRHDLLKQLALVLPPETRPMSPEEAQELLLGLAEEALSGRTGQVVYLEAPEWPPLPASLRRELDGRSIYSRPGVAPYATAAQLSMEERLVAHAAGASRAARARRASRVASRRRSRAATRGTGRPRAHRARAGRAARAAARPGGRRVARAHLGSHRGGDHRPGRHRQDPRPGRHRPGLERARLRHRHLPERHQRTRARLASRSPRTPPGCSATSSAAGSRPAR